jgi:hypothetical protein
MKTCSTCNNEKDFNFFAKNKSKAGGYQSQCKSCVKSHYDKNKEKISEKYKIWYDKNKEQKQGSHKEWYEKNKTVRSEYNKTWRENNVAYCRARNMLRYAEKSSATPPWLTNSDKLLIQEFYITARKLELETGTKYHVDHIVPLQGENVCGLHVPWNLQVITAEENLKKSNKHE